MEICGTFFEPVDLAFLRAGRRSTQSALAPVRGGLALPKKPVQFGYFEAGVRLFAAARKGPSTTSHGSDGVAIADDRPYDRSIVVPTLLKEAGREIVEKNARRFKERWDAYFNE